MLAALQTKLARVIPLSMVGHDFNLGGIDAGLFVPPDGSKPRRLIVPLLPETRIALTSWGRPGQSIPTSDSDGRSNTAAILWSDPDNLIARAISEIEIDGYRDYYWASRLEVDHVYRAIGELVREFLPTAWVWTSTQYSANGAWDQSFDYGYTSHWSKASKASALALRSQ